jgi:hypothetical protein
VALTPSTMSPLGTAAPDFSLQDTVSGKTVTLASFAGRKALLVIFACNHCPYVKHLQDGLVALPGSHPDDAPDRLGAEAKARGYRFPVLFDATQKVAQAYRAACTPDFFVYDAARRLAYRGQFDSSRPGNGRPVTGEDVRSALDAVIAGRPAPSKQQPSVGCNIKWRRGNEPDYFRS